MGLGMKLHFVWLEKACLIRHWGVSPRLCEDKFHVCTYMYMYMYFLYRRLVVAIFSSQSLVW